MSLVVEKYGGSSVASLDRINAVADRILRTREEGHEVVAVVSAMQGETNRLIGLAQEANGGKFLREIDVAISTGEQVAIALLAMVLQSKDCDAVSMTGSQVPIRTDKVFGKARILDIGKDRITKAVQNGKVVVVAGVQGVTHYGEITTLGRGGSDTTAVALAAALDASECRIYTDVDGVFTADPRIVHTAKVLSQITVEEMLELASSGAKVLQIRAVEFAYKHGVILRVLSSFRDVPGTLITLEEMQMEQPLISGVAYNANESKLTLRGVPDRPGVASKIFSPIAEANINVDMIIQNIGNDNNTDVSFTVDRSEYDRCMEILERVVDEVGAKDHVGAPNIAKLSVVGVGMRSHSGIATKMFSVLADEGINIHMISTSEIKISVIVDDKYVELGVRALHKAFELGDEMGPVAEAVPQSHNQG